MLDALSTLAQGTPNLDISRMMGTVSFTAILLIVVVVVLKSVKGKNKK